MIPGSIRLQVIRARRKACEALRIGRYSWMALNELDRKLARYLDFDGGVFVEAGANDGELQSNTYYFEKIRGWTGLLIEPVPELAAKCRRNRRARVVQAALVATEESGATVELHVAGLMSTLGGAMGDAETTLRHVETGRRLQGIAAAQTLHVPARTLSALIDECQITREIDLLSLDVEGGEPAALAGIDFARHAPRFICVEARDRAVIAALLEPRYRLLEVLSEMGTYQDLLYGRR